MWKCLKNANNFLENVFSVLENNRTAYNCEDGYENDWKLIMNAITYIENALNMCYKNERSACKGDDCGYLNKNLMNLRQSMRMLLLKLLI